MGEVSGMTCFRFGIWKLTGARGRGMKGNRCFLSAEKKSESHLLLKRPEMQTWRQELQESERSHFERGNSSQEDAQCQNCH